MTIDYRATILHLVNTKNGIRSVELVLNTMSMTDVVTFELKEFDSTLARLVREGEIVELEYTLPRLDYRVKAMYFPKGTIIKLEK